MIKIKNKNNNTYLEIKKAFDDKLYPNGSKRGCYRNYILRKCSESATAIATKK